jgi:hypothetical protein
MPKVDLSDEEQAAMAALVGRTKEAYGREPHGEDVHIF